MRVLLILVLVLQAGSSPVLSRETLQLGGAAGLSWQENGTLSFIDAESVPGSIRPFETEPTHNLVSSMRSRGGYLRSLLNTYTLDEAWVRGESELVIDGDSTTAYVHEPRIVILGGGGGYWTVPMFFDLGAPFLLDRIRFFTRSEHPENQMRQYVLWFNDGSDETKDRLGDPLWSKYKTEIDNLNSEVEIRIDPPQMVRHIRLRPGTEASNGGLAETWEVAEFQVFGQGFVPTATYVSDPLDLGSPASLGHIHWAWQLDEGARILVQTRTGSDDQPYVYWRKTGVGDEISQFDERGEPLDADDYADMVNTRAGITDDLTNWSPWQTYELELGAEGTQILSPSPRRYVQVRLQFASVGLVGGQVDSLMFDFSEPPVRSAVAEIHPIEVEAAAPTSFTYAIRSRLESNHTGFNSLRLRTAARVDTVHGVRIDRQEIDESSATRDADGSWVVTFPRVLQDQTLLEFDFQARVYRYGTPFGVTLLDTETDSVPLEVVAGDAVADLTGDDLMVRIGLQKDLIADLEVSPNPFTPNGDGRNDLTTVSFSLLRLTEATPVTVRIHELGGRLVRRLTAETEGSQAVHLSWDGRDDAGQLVRPGLYLFHLSIEADGGTEELTGRIAVAY